MDTKILETLEDHERRITKLESLLHNAENVVPKKSKVQKDYAGLKGGIRLLIDQKILDSPLSTASITEELYREGYTAYSKGSIDKLLRDMVKERILGRVKQNKKWAYCTRK